MSLRIYWWPSIPYTSSAPCIANYLETWYAFPCLCGLINNPESEMPFMFSRDGLSRRDSSSPLFRAVKVSSINNFGDGSMALRRYPVPVSPCPRIPESTATPARRPPPSSGSRFSPRSLAVISWRATSLQVQIVPNRSLESHSSCSYESNPAAARYHAPTGASAKRPQERFLKY